MPEPIRTESAAGMLDGTSLLAMDAAIREATAAIAEGKRALATASCIIAAAVRRAEVDRLD